MIAGRERLNAQESRMLDAFSQYEMAAQGALLDRNDHKGHSPVESDSSLFGENGDRAALADRSQEFPEEPFELWRLSVKVRLEAFARAAEMTLVQVRKSSRTFWAAP